MEYDLTGKDKARALKALVNATKPLGMGILQDPGRPMTEEDAARVLQGLDRDPGGSSVYKSGVLTNVTRGHLDYVWGRPIKCNFDKDIIDLRLYDRDAGDGVGKAALDAEFGKASRYVPLISVDKG